MSEKIISDVRETRLEQRKVPDRFQGAWSGAHVDVLLAEIDRLAAGSEGPRLRTALIELRLRLKNGVKREYLIAEISEALQDPPPCPLCKGNTQ